MDGSALTGFCLSVCPIASLTIIIQSVSRWSRCSRNQCWKILILRFWVNKRRYKKSNRLAKHGIWVRSISCSLNHDDQKLVLLHCWLVKWWMWYDRARGKTRVNINSHQRRGERQSNGASSSRIIILLHIRGRRRRDLMMSLHRFTVISNQWQKKQ